MSIESTKIFDYNDNKNDTIWFAETNKGNLRLERLRYKSWKYRTKDKYKIRKYLDVGGMNIDTLRLVSNRPLPKKHTDNIFHLLNMFHIDITFNVFSKSNVIMHHTEWLMRIWYVKHTPNTRMKICWLSRRHYTM